MIALVKGAGYAAANGVYRHSTPAPDNALELHNTRSCRLIFRNESYTSKWLLECPFNSLRYSAIGCQQTSPALCSTWRRSTRATELPVPQVLAPAQDAPAAAVAAAAFYNVSTMKKRGRATNLGWTVRLNHAQAYRQIAAEAAQKRQPAWSTFKRNPTYTRIVSACPEAHGIAYWARLASLHRADLLQGPFWTRVRQGDAIGGPRLMAPASTTSRSKGGSRAAVDTHAPGSVDPTTVRYMNVLADLLSERLLPSRESLAQDDQRPYTVCEIGGGYGGMAHVTLSYLFNGSRISDENHLHNTAVHPSPRAHRYRVYDLPEPAALQRTYLSELGWDAPSFESGVLTQLHAQLAPVVGASRSTSSSDKSSSSSSAQLRALDAVPSRVLDGDAGCDLVLSNYALSELDLATQSAYIRHLVSKARVGVYAIMNVFDESKGELLLSQLEQAHFKVRYEREAVGFTQLMHPGHAIIAHRHPRHRIGHWSVTASV